MQIKSVTSGYLAPMKSAWRIYEVGVTKTLMILSLALS